MALILVVDDSETLRSQVRSSLEAAGHSLLEANDGVHGMEVLNDLPVDKKLDLIICDLNMPRLDGMAMCEKIRLIDRWTQVPIFMLTTESSPALKEKAKSLRITAWITKPFVPEKLIAGIATVMARSKNT